MGHWEGGEHVDSWVSRNREVEVCMTACPGLRGLTFLLLRSWSSVDR